MAISRSITSEGSGTLFEMAGTHKCFNCGSKTVSLVANTKPPQRKKWICVDAKCWEAWWNLSSHKADEPLTEGQAP